MAVVRGGLCSLLLALVVGSGSAFAGEAKAPVGGGRLFNMESSVPVTFYGYIKLDAAYDSSRLENGDFANYVLSESDATTEDDAEFNMTINQTRLGLKLGGLDSGGMKVSGKVEVDFYGGGTAPNKPRILVRHAYAKLDWEEYDLSVIAGQTSDLVSPLFPSTLNYTVMWWQGNIGYRRPQLRLTKGFNLEGAVERIEFAVAATRNIGRATGFDPGDSGEDEGAPGFQARASVKFKLLTDKSTVLGVSGSVHGEEYDTDVDDESTDYDSSMICVDFTVPVTDWLLVKGEFFSGKNLDTFFGGIGQGINAAGEDEIQATGGWVTATLTPPTLEDWTFNAGVGVDDPKNQDLAAGARSRNLAMYCNAIYSLGGGVSMGVEVLQLETKYNGTDDDGDATRVQFSVIYKF